VAEVDVPPEPVAVEGLYELTPQGWRFTPVGCQKFKNFFDLIEDGCHFDLALEITHPEIVSSDPIFDVLRYEAEKPVEYVPIKPTGVDRSWTRMPAPKPLSEQESQWHDMIEAYEVDRDGSNPEALAMVKTMTRSEMTRQRWQRPLGQMRSGLVTAVVRLIAPRARGRRPRRVQASRRARSPGRKDDPEPLLTALEVAP
jgi:hypothetical protein